MTKNQAAIAIPPCWRVVPPGQPAADVSDGVPIVLGPGEGWGDGAHPTTQLCLQAIAALLPCGWQAARNAGHGTGDASAWRMLDFGSGTGILSIGASLLGAAVVGVEIDQTAIATAEANTVLNGVSARARYTHTLDDASGVFDLVVANILRPILLDFADDLVARLAPGGGLILSGLVLTDVPALTVRYAPLLGGRRPEVYQRGDWCALVWR